MDHGLWQIDYHIVARPRQNSSGQGNAADWIGKGPVGGVVPVLVSGGVRPKNRGLRCWCVESDQVRDKFVRYGCANAGHLIVARRGADGGKPKTASVRYVMK